LRQLAGDNDHVTLGGSEVCGRSEQRSASISEKPVTASHLKARFYPESNIGGFSYLDASVLFFSQIHAVLKPEHRVLDFGAGRGEHLIDDPVAYRRRLSDLRGRCAHVEGCDIDPAVLTNASLDHAEVIEPGDPLPYADDSFDIVLSRFVFEHIANPDHTARELVRVVKPGGIIAALTPNKLGYIAIISSLVPNRLHVKALKSVQPTRQSVDVFPTVYKLNTHRAIQREFGPEVDVFTAYISSEPAYYFGSSTAFRIGKFIHKYLPDRIRPLLVVFVRKR